MARNGPSRSEAGRRVERVAIKARPWIERLARVGYLAYGLVYVLVGLLAVQVAFGAGGKTTGQEGALNTILLAPLGRVLLGLVVFGLWGTRRGVSSRGSWIPRTKEDAKGVAKRVDHAINGLFHAALAFSAGQLALGSGAGAARRTTGRRA